MEDNFYENYYLEQAGSGMPVYGGVSVQRGHGLGSILGGLFRSAMPVLKKVGKAVGKQVVRSGLDVASDVVSGTNVKESLKRRALQGAESLLTQQPIKRRPRAKEISSKRKRARKTSRSITRDIFS